MNTRFAGRQRGTFARVDGQVPLVAGVPVAGGLAHPPRQARDRTQQLEQEETLKHQHERSHSKGISM